MAQVDVAEKKTVEWSHGHFHWNERLARDVDRAKRFYRDTIGWTFEAMPTPDGKTYWIAKMGDEPVAGIFDISAAEFTGVPEGWMPYLAVDDVDARVGKATAAGAKLMRPLFDVADVGRIAILTEPGGAGVGWIDFHRRNAPHAAGGGARPNKGGPCRIRLPGRPPVSGSGYLRASLGRDDEGTPDALRHPLLQLRRRGRRLVQGEGRRRYGRAAVVEQDLAAQGKLGPVARLMPTTAATTVRRPQPLVIDGPFAETKEQLLGFYVVDCADLDEAIESARDLAAPSPAAPSRSARSRSSSRERGAT